MNTRAKKSDYKTAFNDLVEEVAYTWFNRIVAIRFMEVNDYLPSRTRVLSSTQNRNEPDIMIDPLSLEDDLGAFSDDDRQLISDAWDTEDPTTMDKLYKMLFIKQANALNKNLPYLFERTNDYAELLFTPSYNHGVIKDIVTEIPESNFDVEQGGQVEIIGWIYQYYNTEPKEKAISSPKSHKFKDTEIASVTQIFTPDWIVKYMVQNSLGKIWIKSLLEKNDTRLEEQIASDFNWQYYMKDAQQPENVIVSLKDVDKSLSNLEITDLKMIDPSMGSGHILVYAFDLLMQIYQSEGYSEREASKSIVTNNLFGLDIDTRAFQLSYFAVYMKLRQYNRRALTSNIKLNIYDIPETNEFNSDDFELLFNELNEHDVTLFNNVINLFHNGNDLGSLIMGLDIDYDDLYQKLSNLNQEQMSFELIPLINSLKQLLSVSKILSAQYHIIITNPPYMGSSRMNKILGNFAKTNYPDAKSDLFSMFIERWNKSMIPGGYNCMVTMQSWMFLSSFEKMRTHLLSNFTISNLMHMENNVMGIAFGTAVTIVRNMNLPNFIGTYHQIKTADTSGKIPSKLPIPGNRYNRTNQANFSKIPGSPIAYWASENLIKDFEK
ncbi:BREX-1 system adenine-specific DNA-methyltransferase PglX, partial [Companilactobacillus alimentarius]|uniref:BREX-1 system adenine-specific DNA-methyltransferase PglX n=1 Tax=Companilactobacillus alimentarius TaxID=1602 RepID=UPI001F21175C